MNVRRMLGYCFGFVAVVSMALSGCSGAGNGPSTTLNVDLSDFAFTPKEVTIPTGKEITLNLNNKGANVHEWVIMKAGTSVTPPFGDKDEGNIYWELDEVQPGMKKSGTFTAPAVGTYELVCGTQGHIEHGMVGKLTVVQ
jgi:uncharacterized cupredoxin-like copper-binding protein